MDKNLVFLKKVKHNDLMMIVNLMKDRISDELTDDAKIHPENHVEEIAEEICLYGGNTVANIGRAMFSSEKTISYHELLQDVCKKKKVSFHPKASTETLGHYLCQKIEADFMSEWDDMSEKEREEFWEKLKESIGQRDFYQLTEKMGGMGGIAALSGGVLLKQLVAMGGIHVYYALVKGIVFFFHTILKTTAPKVLVFAAPQIFKRFINVVLGPIGWGVMGVWTMLDFASPAYRVTIPVAITVEVLRLEYKEK